MAEYAITFARSARKELENIPAQFVGRVIERIEALSQNPRPSGAIKLQGNKPLWRIRVGDFRVIYSIDDSKRKVDVSVVRNRRDVYRDI